MQAKFLTMITSESKLQRWDVASQRIIDYQWKYALGRIDPPKLLTKRGYYLVHELCILICYAFAVIAIEILKLLNVFSLNLF